MALNDGILIDSNLNLESLEDPNLGLGSGTASNLGTFSSSSNSFLNNFTNFSKLPSLSDYAASAFSSLTGDKKSASEIGASQGTSSAFWSDLFLRSVIIILGFIFTSVGLSMFGNKAAITIVNETKRSFGK